MNDWKCVVTLATCCIIILTTAPSASADFVGVTTVIKDDPDTEFLCTQGNGDFVPGPLTVCNVFAVFDNPDDVLCCVGTSDLQVYNGANPDVFFQHPFGSVVTAPTCAFFGAFPDLICDSFITIGWECSPDPTPEDPTPDQTTPDGDFYADEFNFSGHVVGGWFNADPSNGQGDAGSWPDLKVLFLQSSVAQGLSMSGNILHVVWEDADTGDFVVELDVPIECPIWKPDGFPCDDGDPCTGNPGEDGDVWMDGVCGGPPVDCEDGNVCTDDFCDPASGECVNQPNDNPCPTDSDGDGDTDAMDLAVLLGSWGPCAPGEPCECLDNDGSGSIDAFDLAVLLGAWGPCL